MEPPCKRRRVPRNDDPDANFHERRARNDLRLKSAFESIFEKYGKDFSEIADEINLQTGEIVVDRGHVLGMRDETHPGCQEDLYDELNSDDEPEKLDRQGKTDLLGLDPENSLHESIVSASELSCYSEDEPDSLMGDVDVQLSRIEAEVNVGKVFCDGHRDHIFRPGPRPAENGASKLSWKRRLQSRSPAVTSSHQRSLDPSFSEGQAIEPAWRAPPLPKPVASVQETGSVLQFSPHQREHERSASPPGASLWAPEASKRYSERRGGRQKKNSSSSRPKSPAKAQHPTVGKDLPEANVSSLNYEWSRISVCSRPEQIIEGPVPSTLPASPVVLEPPGIAAWTPGQDQLLRILKSARTPYSKMTMYFPERTETDLEDRWFDLHRLNSKLFSLQDVEPRTIDQRTTKSPNEDRQNHHNGSLPDFESHVPDDDYSSADLRGAQERVLLKITKKGMCDTRNLGSEQHPGIQQLKSRKPFNDFGQSTLATKTKPRKPTSELSDQVNSHRDVRSMSPFPENCNVLEEAPEATREKTVDKQWELRIQQDRPQNTSGFRNVTCKNCFSPYSYKWHTKGGSRICNACYHYARKNKKIRPRSLQLKKFPQESERLSYVHMPVRRRNSVSHGATAPDISPSINVPDISPSVKVPKPETRSNKTSKFQTKNEETPRTAKSTTVPDSISPSDANALEPQTGSHKNSRLQTTNMETSRTAKSTTVSTSISPSNANAPEPQTESNKTSRLQSKNEETPRIAKPTTVPNSISPSDANAPEPRTESNKTLRLRTTNKETPRTAKSITVPSSIPPLDDLSEDELSTLVQTVGTPARRSTKLTTTSSHAPRRHTLHV